MALTPLASLSQAMNKSQSLPSIDSLKPGLGRDLFKTQRLGNVKNLDGVLGSGFGRALDNVSKLASMRKTEAPSFGGSLSQAGQSTKSSSGFSGMAMDFISSVDSQSKRGQVEAQKVLNNQSNNVHQSMIALQESKVAFNLMVQMRNKLVEGLKEVMSMNI
tara:strand:+ start:6658 stop:7140 length:483 start_codon:yes stop_codon:yes gene_type:complete